MNHSRFNFTYGSFHFEDLFLSKNTSPLQRFQPKIHKFMVQ